MEKLQGFFESYTFIVGFMITCIFIDMLLGSDFLNKFLWLVLTSMLLINSDKFISLLQKKEG